MQWTWILRPLAAASSEVTSCLEEGWRHPADAIKEERTGELLEEAAARLREVNPCMVSLIQIDKWLNERERDGWFCLSVTDSRRT
jgi:hypothetical protein